MFMAISNVFLPLEDPPAGGRKVQPPSGDEKVHKVTMFGGAVIKKII
jgi:hypothetical protein